ncbi:MAG: radical SAM protein [Elusimicrobiales bacterium]|nr:radical SAM protein [Elusimicrobiales bacterium]
MNPSPPKTDLLLVRPKAAAMGVFKAIGASQPPINLVYLATWLNAHGFKAAIYDLEVSSAEGLRRTLEASAPVLVGITGMTTDIPAAKEICLLCRELKIKTVIGGAHASALPAETLTDAACDFAVVGEGERPLLELVTALKNGGSFESIAGLAFMRGGKPAVNQRGEPLDIDLLPIPDRRLLDKELYAGGYTTPGVPAGGTVMFTSRGCPYRCAFCASQVINGPRARLRAMDKVLREVDEIAALGYKHITVDDDTFALKKSRVLEFSAHLERNYPGLTWNCDARAGELDEEMLAAMKRSGCRKIAVGAESGSQRVLDSIRKGTTVGQIKETFRLIKKHGIQAQAFFMIGHPEETREDLAGTVKLIHEIKPDLVSLAISVPLPGTENYLKAKADGFLPEGLPWQVYDFFGSSVPWRTKHFTGAELVKLRGGIGRGYYFSFPYISRKLLSIRGTEDLKYLVKGALAALKVFKK